MADLRRILDANANRAREAARVMEDAARFLLDDETRAKKLKHLRHDLVEVMQAYGPLAAARNTPGDVGTALQTVREAQRHSARDVVRAAGKRLAEALRSLEEYGKTLDAKAAARLEALRYRGYDLEQQLLLRLGPGAVQWRLCAILTPGRCAPRDWRDVARAALDGGADCLQIRDKAAPCRALADAAAELRDKAGRRAQVIVNDRPDAASMGGAHGVHLGQQDATVAIVRRIDPDLLAGLSTHSLAEARRAVQAGADYCGVGTIFHSETKKRRLSGLKYLAQFVQRYPGMPHLAIGGIAVDNVSEAVDAGARGVAVCDAVCGAKRPDTAVRRLLRKIPKARKG